MPKETELLTRLLIRVCVLFTALAWVSGLAAAPAQVILLRHAEKPRNEADRHLSPIGEMRAKALVDLFSTNAPWSSNCAPVALFAPKAGRDGSGVRPRETLEPLAKRLGLPIRTPYSRKDHAELIQHLLSDPEFDGKTVVVCWVHEYLGLMAKELGVARKVGAWPSKVYDRLWVVSWAGARGILTSVPQRLLPGDSTR